MSTKVILYTGMFSLADGAEVDMNELDVVAFNPEEKHLVHIEPSVDQRS
jgi:hypothetical protein